VDGPGRPARPGHAGDEPNCQGYYAAFGGQPGLPYLLREFSAAMEARGLGAVVRRRLFVDNPARAFAFAEVNR